MVLQKNNYIVKQRNPMGRVTSNLTVRDISREKKKMGRNKMWRFCFIVFPKEITEISMEDTYF